MVGARGEGGKRRRSKQTKRDERNHARKAGSDEAGAKSSLLMIWPENSGIFHLLVKNDVLCTYISVSA